MHERALDLTDSGLLSVGEVAKILGTSRGYVWRLAYRGDLTKFLVGRTPFFLLSEVEAYRDSHPRLGSRRLPA